MKKGKNEFGRIIDPSAMVEPELHAKDPATGVAVAIGRRDYGAEAALRGQVVTDAHTGRRRVLPPKRVIEVMRSEVEGRQVEVSTVVTTLRLMYRKGSITQDQYDVGCDFKRSFDIAGMDGMRVPSLERSPVAGGFRQMDEPMRIIQAKDYIFNALGIVGGTNTGMGIAMWNVIGLETGFSVLAAKHGGTRVYWSGCLVNALDLLAVQLKRGGKSR